MTEDVPRCEVIEVPEILSEVHIEVHAIVKEYLAIGNDQIRYD